MTLKDIAKEAGVSVGTVSKAFAGSDEIGIKTRERIFDIAKRNGCYEKYKKDKYSQKVIAIICPELGSEFYTRIVDEFEKHLNGKYGAVVNISISRFDSERERELFEYHAFVQKADGIIVIGAAEKIVNSGYVPMILMDTESKNFDKVGWDMKKAIMEAVKYLKDRGHTEIGYIGEKRTHGKYTGYVSAMKAYGLALKSEYVKVSERRFEDGGYEAMSEIISGGVLPTAIIAAYDYMAIGAIRCIKEHGLSVPGDISVMGIDNISADRYLDIPLTSIHIPFDNLFESAADMLMKKINNKYYVSDSDVIAQCGIIERKSVRDIRETRS